ncbi:unnamed protein product [Brassica napus]|uniref:(rape) hypothetical protein n=1 Tax=Brassica napus TaxID=3708 RepID=A0A816T4W6_BRANA|nr:unnamed protein product [Brassica napus]
MENDEDGGGGPNQLPLNLRNQIVQDEAILTLDYTDLQNILHASELN